MEVHHLSKDHPKNWKEHFKEFFMMFLAVTLGFFAENHKNWRFASYYHAHGNHV